MSSYAKPNIVHESEAQRQYVRVRMPATLEIGANRFALKDISAGGFLLSDAAGHLQSNTTHQGKITINVDGFDFSLSIGFRTLDNRNNQSIGCRIVHIDPPAADALKHILTAYLAGEVVRSGEILHTLNRNNEAKSRQSSKALKAPTTLEKSISLFGTVGIFVIGLFAFAWVVGTVANNFLVRTSAYAMVDSDAYSVIIPSAGLIQMMVPKEAKSVSQGQLIATYEVGQGAINLDGLPEQTRTLLASLELPVRQNTIFSPCNCDIVSTHVRDGEYLEKGQPVIELLPTDLTPKIVANFSFEDAKFLKLGETVSFTLFGADKKAFGKVRSMNADEHKGQVIVNIEPDEPLSSDLHRRPVTVVSAPAWIQNTVLSSL